ncbi:GYF domain protein [Cordyceps fumosorosea ARSEF 2679]|uniref:GYF domain protein n=1 Tax=Cordyceps fumosorosea (strain ARSEF 2679) TaxID=1081104 RepID=A0A162JKV1_CORFA|nr:GYF domain protein [Cordyceps fumosorosea ARSEF 2679]OAA70452.1 GYF domain protein [Cordyceps fumosorosea ARSEF 2679]
MSSRHGAGRPRRDGETFARTHHHDNEQVDDSRVKFDVRNPSTLAPDAREDDAILDADVIGASASTKRGAVNLDGYDSDSDNDTFNARAESRKKGKVDINEQLDNYDNKAPHGGPLAAKNDDDDDDDMFAAADGEDREDDDDGPEASSTKKKKVQFMEANEIEGQDQKSKSGGTIHLDDDESSDAESEKELRAQEEDVDEEVGAGGLKRNAPKVEAFNLNDEMEEGRFDDQGNYVRKAGDPDAVHDNWLNGLSKKDMKKAAEAHEKRQSEARKLRLEDDGLLSSDLLKTLIIHLERAETPLEALARLGKGQKKTKKIPQWKLKKMKKGMDVDQEAEQPDTEQLRIKAAIDAITEAADKLLSRGLEEVYDQEREMLVREYRKDSGEDWVEPSTTEGAAVASAPDSVGKWEFRWVDGRDDGSTQGPFDGPTMKAWQDAGYFGQGIEFRPAGGSAEWSQETPSFL